MTRTEIKGRLNAIISRYPANGGHVVVGVTVPEAAGLEAFAGSPETGVAIAQAINAELGLATNARCASHSGIIYARFPAR